VGKIYKPTLRCDAAARLVARVVRDELRLADARVEASEGGKRGMRVTVALPADRRAAAADVEQAMAAYLFEAVVTVGA
jgi:fatty-acyl-CoA synthase